jgi:hypothetical protein
MKAARASVMQQDTNSPDCNIRQRKAIHRIVTSAGTGYSSRLNIWHVVSQVPAASAETGLLRNGEASHTIHLPLTHNKSEVVAAPVLWITNYSPFFHEQR